MLYPTMVIGSLPRPQWVIDLIDEREREEIGDDEFDALIEPAIRFAIRMQERAGIDIVTDGEWRRRTYFTGFARAVSGFANDVIEVTVLDGSAMKWPGIVSKLEYTGSIAVEEARFVRRHTSCKVKVTLPTPYMIDRWFYDPDASGSAYGSREELEQDAEYSHIWSLAQKSSDQGGRTLDPNKTSHTIRAECHGNNQFHYKLPRRISMREAARFQTFPDNFIFKARLRETERMIGNAVPPVLAWLLGKSLRATLEQFSESSAAQIAAE